MHACIPQTDVALKCMQADAVFCIMQFQTIRKATITYRPYHRNYYHSLGESIFAVHSLACTYYGYCHYGEGSDLTAIFLDSPQDPFDWDTSLPSANEALQCLTPHHAYTVKDRKLCNKARCLNANCLLTSACLTCMWRQKQMRHQDHNIFTCSYMASQLHTKGCWGSP